ESLWRRLILFQLHLPILGQKGVGHHKLLAWLLFTQHNIPILCHSVVNTSHFGIHIGASLNVCCRLVYVEFLEIFADSRLSVRRNFATVKGDDKIVMVGLSGGNGNKIISSLKEALED